jgi:hypothetical protein
MAGECVICNLLMKKTTLFILLCCHLNLSAQTDIVLHFQPSIFGEKLALEKGLKMPDGDSIALHTLRFYLSNFVFYNNGTVVFAEQNSYHLLDLEDEASMILPFSFLQKFDFDSLNFKLGVDSATTVLGAMGGDLDPARGMFWAWQSGYINFKLEGFSQKSPARDGEFQFHLGGYLPPFQSLQVVGLKFGNTLNPYEIRLDLAPFFEKIDWSKKSNIMSPCREAVNFSKILAKSFHVHAR